MSTLPLVPALAVSAALFVGGAWLASEVGALALVSPSETAAADGSGGGLTVIVEGLRSDAGSLVVLVFDDAEAFAATDTERLVGYLELPAGLGPILARFTDLVAGPYAVTLWHDEDSDGDFDTEGDWPLEGYGWSGSAGPETIPSFAEAAVEPGEIAIRIFYAP